MKQQAEELSLQVIENIKNIILRTRQAALLSGRNISDIQIMAVTKTVPPYLVNVALQNGISLIGENRVQEFLEKLEKYIVPKEQIHFIGHLQTNKVKYIIDKVSLIESVDSVKLAEEIDCRAAFCSKKMEILLEINISEEASKGGFFEKEIKSVIEKILKMENITLKGFMCIPEKGKQEEAFSRMRKIFDTMQKEYHRDANLTMLSMGMSQDFETAVYHGSNLIRLGTAIFGQRNVGGKGQNGIYGQS